MTSPEYLIKNALIIDGRNKPPFRGSLLIRDGRIAAVEQNPDPCPEGADIPVIDAAGAYVTPGFIDIHRHGDRRALRGRDGGDDELLNRQGITTVVNGNCGLSVTPACGEHREEIRHFLEPVTGFENDPSLRTADTDLGAYFRALSGTKRTVNTGMLAGNGTIRACAAGYRPGKLLPEEEAEVRRHIEKALEDGALGISLGLGYAPEFEYDAAGLIRVLAPLENTDIPITTHIRSEGDGSCESVEEVISVAEALNIPLHISHMKCIGRRNWHTGPERTLELIHRKNAEGMRIDFDLYPYRAGATQLFHVIPPAFQAGGTEKFLEGLKKRSFRDALTKALQTPSHEFENIVELVGLDHISAGNMVSREFRDFSGRDIERIASERGADPYETLYDILSAEKCEVSMLDTIACEEDICTFYRDPLSSVISDAIYPDGGRLHPRVYGAFPHFLVHYIRELRLLPIETAILKMTSQPAAVLHIDRGVIREGAAADLCIFDINELCASASYDDPERLCTGFRYVFVGGEPVVRDDVWQEGAAGAGRVIRRGRNAVDVLDERFTRQ